MNAINGRKLTSGFYSPVSYFDTTPPQISDIRIYWTVTQSWATSSCQAWSGGSCTTTRPSIWTNDSTTIRTRFYVSEPGASSSITSVKWSIGSSPGATDAQAWLDIGAASALASKSGAPYFATASKLNLHDGYTYFANFKTVNSMGLSAIFVSPGFTVDLTGFTRNFIWFDISGDIQYTANSQSIHPRYNSVAMCVLFKMTLNQLLYCNCMLQMGKLLLYVWCLRPFLGTVRCRKF